MFKNLQSNIKLDYLHFLSNNVYYYFIHIVNINNIFITQFINLGV